MITGVVLARNEAGQIVPCLQALRPHVAEIILIDMQSTDGTLDLARPLVDTVLDHPHVPNFDAARNIATSVARYDWMWFVDADEIISPETGAVVNDLIRVAGDKCEAIAIPFKSYFCGQWMQHCGWWPGYTMPRVLKRGHFRFVDRLHGGVQVSGRQLMLPADPKLGIDHYSYRSVEHYLEKLNRYTSVEAEHLKDTGATWDWRRGIREMAHDLWHYYERNPGYLDGERGWILSWLSGQYRWLSHAKAFDSRTLKSNAHSSIPSDIDKVLETISDELSTLRATQPQLPLGVLWRSPIWDHSGYADEGRTIVKALARGRRTLALEDILWSHRRCQIPLVDETLLRALSQARRPRYAATISNCIPSVFVPDPRSSLNIIRTTFETDRIPGSWHEPLSHADEIWVMSQHNYRAFRRSGVPPEKIRVVPSCIDTDLFRPDGERLDLPTQLQGRFVFLSIFDWGLRKGWDVLLAAYCQEFHPNEGAGLLLKITRSHGHSIELVLQQIDSVLNGFKQSRFSRPDVVIVDSMLDTGQLAALYRSVNAFVLASRGEGWGRPYMEAMASALPTIGTRASGNLDFMDDTNSLLLSANVAAVSHAAAAEIPVFRGHQWFEPDLSDVRRQLRRAFSDHDLRERIGKKACDDIRSRFGLKAGQENFESALHAAESRFRDELLASSGTAEVGVELEGEFFAGHSFSQINEHLALHFSTCKNVELSLRRVHYQPTYDRQSHRLHRLRPFFDRPLASESKVTIRHAFPPNWEPPQSGSWIHIQPWEYGHLPSNWVPPLRDVVDEIWVPSQFVRLVYERSGIPSNKIQVIPWGLDPDIFTPDAPPWFLQTDKSCVFLFVGGAIARKGIDVLLEAYLSEFGPNDDVCLVVKDIGSESFYRDSPFRKRLIEASLNSNGPAILYIDRLLTDGQLASLYTACDCLVAPYRGEGFGLPILEAMGCGVPVIVPRGGPSDDYVTEESGLFVPSQTVTVDTQPDLPLCGAATEIQVDANDLRAMLRYAYSNREHLRAMGRKAAAHVHSAFTWNKTAQKMIERLQLYSSRAARSCARLSAPSKRSLDQGSLCAFVVVRDDGATLGDCLARLAPFIDELVVVAECAHRRCTQIAREYGARVYDQDTSRNIAALRNSALSAIRSDWILVLDSTEIMSDADIERLRPYLLGLPSDVLVVGLQKTGGDATAGLKPSCELRVFRMQAGLVFEENCNGPAPSIRGSQFQVANTSIVLSHNAAADSFRTAAYSKLPISEYWLVPWVPHQGRVFLDVGANVGTWTRWLASGYQTVYAIEPNPEALTELRKELPKNATVYEIGAWSCRQEVKFTRFAQSAHLSAYFEHEGINTGPKCGEVRLPCCPLDELCIDGTVTLLKCDVEGAEVECLLGAERLIQRDRPWLLLECHSAENFSRLAEMLNGWRYSCTIVRHPHYEPLSDLWHAHCWFSCQPR